jgi:recombination DNA repair RAD52 pathway protein
MSKNLEQIREELDAKIPRDAISNRSAGNGLSLSYLEGWYVIDRLNKVVGQGNWQYEAEAITRVFETTIERGNKKGRAVSYTATVRLTAEFGDKVVSFVDIGAGKGIDYGTGLEADESAVKEAVTDGLKRCAKNLGMSMGLALYDKSQENVDDEDSKPVALERPVTDSNQAPRSALGAPVKIEVTKDTLKEKIERAVRVLNAQNKLTVAQFKTKFELKTKLADLDADRLNSIVDTLNIEYPELALKS